MPLYPYECETCHEQELALRSVDERDDCPRSRCCGATTVRRIVRQFQIIGCRIRDLDMNRNPLSGLDALDQERQDVKEYEADWYGKNPGPSVGELQYEAKRQRELAGIEC